MEWKMPFDKEVVLAIVGIIVLFVLKRHSLAYSGGL